MCGLFLESVSPEREMTKSPDAMRNTVGSVQTAARVKVKLTERRGRGRVGRDLKGNIA